MKEREESFIPKMTALLRMAGDAVMDIYRSGDYHTETKSDNTPLTKADKTSNSIVSDGLARITPGIPLISEETSHLPYETRKHYNEVWILDPIDGTREFVDRNGEFCICLALIRGQRPVAGFILAPVTGELWYAIEGQGAWKQAGGITTRLPLQSPPQPPVILISRSHHNETEKKWIERFRADHNAEVSIQGSAIKFCRLAEGKASLYPKFGPINEWDVAAGDIILKEAGGSVTETLTGKEPVYNKESLVQPYFIAETRRLTIYD